MMKILFIKDLFLLLIVQLSYSQNIPAFPGAEGFGANAKGPDPYSFNF